MSPDLAESLEVARGIARWRLGDSARVLAPDTASGAYSGRIIGETKYHMIQRISAESAIAHPKRLLREPPLVDDIVRITYTNDCAVVRPRRARERAHTLGR